MITNLFSIPDKEKNFQGYMLYIMVLIWSIVTGLIVSTGFFIFPDLWLRWATFLCVSVLIGVVSLSLNQSGYIRPASWTFIVMLWLYITVPCYTAGGILAPGILTQTCLILTSAYLLGWKNGLMVGLVTVGVDFWFAYLQYTGNMASPLVVHNPITRWITAIIPFGTILAIQYYTTNHLRTSLVAMQREITKREKVEKEKDQTLYELGERLKELKTLYSVSRILQKEDMQHEIAFKEIAEVLPPGWQYPEITGARVCVGETEYATTNYRPSPYNQLSWMTTAKGTRVGLEIVYLESKPEMDEGPFMKEERSLINMLVEMLKTNIERWERQVELNDYKYALDIASIVSISGVDGRFSFVNDNFCSVSKYTSAELLGVDHSILWSGLHPPEYFDALTVAMQDGRPFRGEFCNKAKDGSLYWTDTTIIPFLDRNGSVYQYLSINHDITKRKIADDKIKESEQLLKRLTSQIPGNTYMFEIDQNGSTKVMFMNRGTDMYNHSFDIQEVIDQPEKLREVLHEEDKIKFNNAMKAAYQKESAISFQYRILVNDQIRWRWMQAIPGKDQNGKVLWYGATSDITPLIDHIASIEQILWDVSHVIRRPVASMLGLTGFINDHELSPEEIKELSKKLHTISLEMDSFIREITLAYNQKKDQTHFKIDVRSLIDLRPSIFG